MSETSDAAGGRQASGGSVARSLTLALALVIVPATAGCLGQAGEDDGHEVTIETSYEREQTPEEHRGKGPPPGTAADGGELFLHLVEPEHADDYREQLEGGLFDPPAPRPADEHQVLSIPENRTSERYMLPLGSDGVGEFSVREPVETFVDVEGHHPSPPGDCGWHYINDGTPSWLVEGDRNLTLAYGITC
jgi:hypothetical protein